MIVLLFWFVASGRLSPEMNEDSDSYLGNVFPLSDSLRSIRTLGYPVLANIVRVFSPQLEAMPLIHVLCLYLAVFSFYFGLKKLGATPWLSVAVAGSLLYFPPMLTHGHILIPEVTAAAGAVFTLGVLFWNTAHPGSWVASVGFCAGLFFNYQMRPAYLFLIALTPLLGVLLRYAYAQHHGVTPRLLRCGMRLSALALVPYFVFCLFRWFMVGHFGLVSFGGMNLIGVGGQFLNDETIANVPAHLQPLADKMLEIRKNDDHWPDDHARYRLSFRQAETLYNPVIYNHFLAAYDSLPNINHTSMDASQKGGALAWSLIRSRPNLYACWIGDAYRTGLFRLPTLSWYLPLHTLNMLLLAVLGTLGLIRFIQRCWLGRVAAGEVRTPGLRFVCGCVLLVGISFALSKLLLICLVEAPLPRYLDAVYMFLPTLTGIVAHETVVAVRNHVVGTVK
jgi:hypothetical protein